jgi:hypothetical protein
MSNYRIKIEEKNNGQKHYIPQVCKLEIKKTLFGQTQELVWYNIIHDYGNTFGSSKTMWVTYGTEKSALKVIEAYKNKDVIKEGNKVKSTTYKMID